MKNILLRKFQVIIKDAIYIIKLLPHKSRMICFLRKNRYKYKKSHVLDF